MLHFVPATTPEPRGEVQSWLTPGLFGVELVLGGVVHPITAADIDADRCRHSGTDLFYFHFLTVTYSSHALLGQVPHCLAGNVCMCLCACV